MQTMKDEKQQPAKMPRIGLTPATEVIDKISDGDLGREMTARLAELVRAVQACPDQKGTITLKLTVASGNKTMSIVGDITAKIPRPKLDATLMYAQDNGSLSIENPRQTKMPFEGPRAADDNTQKNEGGE